MLCSVVFAISLGFFDMSQYKEYQHNQNMEELWFPAGFRLVVRSSSSIELKLVDWLLPYILPASPLGRHPSASSGRVHLNLPTGLPPGGCG